MKSKYHFPSPRVSDAALPLRGERLDGGGAPRQRSPAGVRVAAVVGRGRATRGGVGQRSAVLVERRGVHVPSGGGGVVGVAGARPVGGRHACDGGGCFRIPELRW